MLPVLLWLAIAIARQEGKMSSLRNAIPRRAHKERAQPDARKKFGLLEKHKDYVVRARAYHIKEATIAKLKEKAAFKNPDEFYFRMINSRTVGGNHRPKPEANKYTEEELLMKNKDMGYILQSIQSEKKPESAGLLAVPRLIFLSQNTIESAGFSSSGTESLCFNLDGSLCRKLKS